ncbi:MAG TPA: hypothetical protein VFB42_05460 [Gaiellaceae bacterium]|nr:hypothetical protein [Gaiellaceae bacterium]
MRTLVAFLVAGAAATAGGAVAARGPATDLSVSTYKVLYGHPVTLSGSISSGRSGRAVAVFARRFDHAAWHRIATVTTGAGGRFELRSAPPVTTAFRARAGHGAFSAVRTVGVRPLVTVRELPRGAVLAEVTAGRPLAGGEVRLQARVGGTWATLAKRRLDALSAARFGPLGSSATIRVTMSVNEAGAGYLGTISHPFVYRPHTLTLAISTFRVRHGDALVLSGRVGTRLAGERVTVTAVPFGAASPRRVATVTTAAGGRFRVRAAPGIQTTYAASWGVVRSPRVTVGVEPRLDVRELADGHVRVRVLASRSFGGRTVKLQLLLPGGTWQTIAKKPLDRRSTATFRPDVSNATIRLALSVNQAGAGYLGAWSRALRYHAA